MDNKAKHCKACQSRDIRPFVSEVKKESSTGIPKSELASYHGERDEPLPKQAEPIKLDPQYLVEPKVAESDLRPKSSLYFPSDPKRARKNASKSAKSQRKSRLAARGRTRITRKSSFGASLALFGPIALVIVFLGTIAFGVVPDEIKKGQDAWAKSNTVPERLLPLVEVETKGSFEWLSGGKISRAYWDPCRTIYWVVNPKNEPVIARQMMADAFSEVGARTGLKFEFLGETTEAFNSNRSPVNTKYPNLDSDWSPVVVNYLGGSQFESAVSESGNSDPADVAAFAGPESAFDKDSLEVYVSGSVTVSSDWFEQSMNDWGGLQTKAVFLHELGHLVGLDHVTAHTELMYAENNGLTKFGPGDRKGLALAGQAKCLAPSAYPIPGWTDWSDYD